MKTTSSTKLFARVFLRTVRKICGAISTRFAKINTLSYCRPIFEHLAMSRFYKIILISMYSTVSVFLIRSLIIGRNIEIVEIDYLFRRPVAAIQRELTIEKRVVALFTEKKKLERLPTDFKYILKWSQLFSHSTTLQDKSGQESFLEKNCTYTNCYLTSDKGLIPDLTFFDAILFDVEDKWDAHPLERSQYQRFIFVASESAEKFPVCTKVFNNYYNLTFTYKLDSDISNAYLSIFDKNGTLVGPKINMTWVEPMDPTPDEVKEKLKSKNKAVAWFVSNCNAKRRKEVANDITNALIMHGLYVDVFGWCGRLQCPQNQFQECLNLLRDHYYFYFAFENSFAEDYVTEKVLHGIMNYAVPIVFGGANYSRFLPPGSYINAKEQDAMTVARQITEAIKDRKIYESYFRWHNHYTYVKAGGTTSSKLCKLCEIMNSPFTFTAKNDFKKWWNEERMCDSKK